MNVLTVLNWINSKFSFMVKAIIIFNDLLVRVEA